MPKTVEKRKTIFWGDRKELNASKVKELREKERQEEQEEEERTRRGRGERIWMIIWGPKG